MKYRLFYYGNIIEGNTRQAAIDNLLAFANKGLFADDDTFIILADGTMAMFV